MEEEITGTWVSVRERVVLFLPTLPGIQGGRPLRTHGWAPSEPCASPYAAASQPGHAVNGGRRWVQWGERSSVKCMEVWQVCPTWCIILYLSWAAATEHGRLGQTPQAGGKPHRLGTNPTGWGQIS